MIGWRHGATGFVFLALAPGACTVDPGAPLIPTPAQPATISPSQAPARTADGFPNILADPVVVGGGLPRPQRVVDAEAARLAASRARAQAVTRRIPRTNFAGELTRQASTSVSEARAQIAASGRSRASEAPMPDPDDVMAEARAEIAASGSRPSAAPAPSALATAVVAPEEARSIDPDAPLPRAALPAP